MTHEANSPQSLDDAHQRGKAMRATFAAWQDGRSAAPTWAIATFVVVAAVAAVLEQRADALLAWDNWLDLYFGLFLPVVALALSLRVVPRKNDFFSVDAARARLGASRRTIRMRRLVVSVTWGLALGSLVILLGRFIAFPATAHYLSRDLAVCLGLGALATATYIPCFAALEQTAVGRKGAIVALMLDLTLGHAEGSWAYLLPHPHLASLLNNAGNSLVSPLASSWILLGVSASASAWIWLRTPR